MNRVVSQDQWLRQMLAAEDAMRKLWQSYLADSSFQDVLREHAEHQKRHAEFIGGLDKRDLYNEVLRLRARVKELEQRAYEESWRTNPDQMGR